ISVAWSSCSGICEMRSRGSGSEEQTTMTQRDVRPLPVEHVAQLFGRVAQSVGAMVVGQDEALELCNVTLLVGGHALLQGVPGVGKTLLVRTLASALGLRFGRVQFTPDLMPSDVLGSQVYEAARSSFSFRPGPIFTDLLLGDEINRAPAKTQAAM